MLQTIVSVGDDMFSLPSQYEMDHFLEHLWVMLPSSAHPSPIVNEIGMSQRGIRSQASTSPRATRFTYRGVGQESLRWLVGVLIEAYRDFRIDPHVFENEKQAVVNELKEYMTDPDRCLDESLSRFLYGSQPIAQYTFRKAVRSCRRLTVGAVRSCWRFHGSAMLFLIVGRFDPAPIRAHFKTGLMETVWGSPIRSVEPPVFVPPTDDTTALVTILPWVETRHVRVLWLTDQIPYLSLEYEATACLDWIMARTLASRLYRLLRLDQGLVYSILPDRDDDGDRHFVYGYATTVDDPAHTDRVVGEIRHQADRLCRARISRRELTALRQNLRTVYCTEEESRRQPGVWAAHASEYIRLGRPIRSPEIIHDYLSERTAEDIRDLARRIFGQGRCIIQIGTKRS